MLLLSEKFSNIIYNQGVKNTPQSESVNSVLDSLNWLESILESHKMFFCIMHSPIIQKEQKIKLINEVAKNSGFVISKIASNLFIILIRMRQLKILGDIISSLRKKSLKEQGISEVSVCFASDPSSDQLKTVEMLLTTKYKLKAQFKLKIQTKIAGGFMAFFEGKMLDASLSKAFTKLADLSI
jgi:ATP synthase F1 delta subunit